MHSGNPWGGLPMELTNNGDKYSIDDNDYQKRHSLTSSSDWDKAALYNYNQQREYSSSESDRFSHLDETQRGWLLGPVDHEKKMKKKYVDLGFILCDIKLFKWTILFIFIAFCVIGLPIIISNNMPIPKSQPLHSDNYSIALSKALLFFNAQKSGRLTKNNGIEWRGNSGLSDGKDTDVKGGLVGGYYDAGDNVKFHFPLAYAMTMLSWSVIEYPHKFEKNGEYNHIRDLIKWGSDYLLLTFNYSSTQIDRIYCQVGGSQKKSNDTPNDHYCWQRPEDMDYPRPTQTCYTGPDLAGEMAAAFAAASILFRDNEEYSYTLIKGAETIFNFARDFGKHKCYSIGNPYIEPFYSSSGYFDEYIWGATWLYYATGNTSYLSLATNHDLAENSKAFDMIPDLSVPSWDNKLPSAMLLLTRFRVFLNPGYPYEEILRMYHDTTTLNMCSYLKRFHVFKYTQGGLILLNKGGSQPLQYVANTAFLASLFVDYMNASGVPGFYCGPTFIALDVLRTFAFSQIDYILGKNPMNMSYVVGFGSKFPRHVHHRGASIPNDHKAYSCTGGWKWRDSLYANPNNITGAMVGGPDQLDQFKDVRNWYNNTEPTMVGNAGLVAALASLITSAGNGIDKNNIFQALPPLGPPNRAPLAPWKP